jgi:hypothetical protein
VSTGRAAQAEHGVPMQADSSVAPLMLENLPASHFMHTSADDAPPWFSAWYVPAGQSRHTPSLYAPTTPEYLPAGQSRQALSSEAAVEAEYLPAPQSVQSVEPLLVLYFPARQAVHAAPTPVYPGSHRHSVAPESEVEYSAHSMHASEPCWSEYLPASQRLQASEPAFAL